MVTHRFLFMTIFSGLFLVPQLIVAEDESYYMWTDENGVVNFSQGMPKDYDATLIEKPHAFGRKSITPSLPESEPLMAEGKENVRTRELNCLIGKKALEKLQGAEHIILRGSDGWWRRITEEQRQEKVRETEQIIEENC